MSEEHGAGSAGAGDELVAALRDALAVGTRDAFTDLLTDDVHWGGEHGGNECSSRAEAGDHYDRLLAAGVTLHITKATQVGDVRVVQLAIGSPDPADFPAELTVRLTLRDGLVADICELGPRQERIRRLRLFHGEGRRMMAQRRRC